MSGILDPEEAHLAALRRLADFGGARVVEVGCGDGRLTLGIAERAASVLALDPDDDAVARARAALPEHLLDRVSYRVASATEIEIPRSAYDVVVFSWSLCCIEPKDVVHVLRRFRNALVQEGIVLDLQVIRPHPHIETDGQVFSVADGSPLFVRADAARAAVDLLIAEGLLVEEAVDDHDVLKHYDSGAALVEDWAPKERKLPAEAVPLLQTIERECVVRERCRLRRLRRVEPSRSAGRDRCSRRNRQSAAGGSTRRSPLPWTMRNSGADGISGSNTRGLRGGRLPVDREGTVDIVERG